MSKLWRKKKKKINEEIIIELSRKLAVKKEVIKEMFNICINENYTQEEAEKIIKEFYKN